MGHPQARGSGGELKFDIPSQSLESAIEAYGATSHLQLLYESSLTAGRYSAEVRGLYTPEAALRRLLSGTGLNFDYTEERSLTLLQAQPGTEAVRPREVANFEEFLGSVQASVLAALCRRPETRPGAFRVAMQFNVGGAGELENLNLLSTTGQVSRDTAITGALMRLGFGEAPPPEMPQPITMVLLGAPSKGDDECRGLRR